MKFKIQFILMSSLVILNVNSQTHSKHNEKKEEYEVINRVLKSQQKIYISKKFKSLTSINKYFQNADSINNLMGHCIENQKILSIFDFMSLDELNIIKETTSKHHKRNIKENKLADHIILCKCKNQESCSKNNIKSITKPIFIDKKAVVSVQSENQGNILLLQKEKGKWEIKCNKRMYLTIVNPIITKD